MLTDHAIELVLEGGMGSVTLPEIARRIGVTRQSVTAWAGGNRAELLDIVVGRFVYRWRELLDGRLAWHGALSFLPYEEEEVRWTRVRLAFEEQERTTPRADSSLASLRDYERELLQAAHPALRISTNEVHLHLLTTLLDGLRAALTRPMAPMTVDRARHLFWDECSRLAGDPAAWMSPYAPWGPSASLPAGRQAE
jgi:AcrR family transcriptional regulator